MKTFELIMQIKWHVNDNGGDRRPLTIDCENHIEFKNILKDIRNKFMTLGNEKSVFVPIDMQWTVGEKPFEIKFLNISERT